MKSRFVKFKTLRRYNNPGDAHGLTFSCYHQRGYLSDEKACEIFLEELESARNKYLFEILAYVLMPTHVHLIVRPTTPKYDIGKMQGEIKGKMSTRYRKHILTNKPELFNFFWCMIAVRKEMSFVSGKWEEVMTKIYGKIKY